MNDHRPKFSIKSAKIDTTMFIVVTGFLVKLTLQRN